MPFPPQAERHFSRLVDCYLCRFVFAPPRAAKPRAGTTLKVVPDCFPERPVPLLCRGLPWFQNPLIDGKGLL